MSNRATETAGHHQTPIIAILTNLRSRRSAWVSKLDSVTEADVARLQQRMRLVDWAYFVAEHDDHHLAAIRSVLVNSVERK